MRRIGLYIVLSIVLIIICGGTSGCSNDKEDVDTINYDKYIEKIWVVESWTGGAYDDPSFYISNIQNGEVEGRYSTGAIAQPDFYFYSNEPSKYLGHLTGTIKKGVVDAKFSDKVGNKGNLVVVFKEDERIEVNVEYTEKGENYNEIDMNGDYIFRPFNLKDIQYFKKIEEHSIDMNSWGNVIFISGEINTGNIIHPVACIANENNNIFYVFDAPFKTGTVISDVAIEDVNNDGLKDVIIITSFVEDDEREPIKWVFLQKEDGSFYDSSLSIE